MFTPFSRRRFVGTAAAAAAWPLLSRAAGAEPSSAANAAVHVRVMGEPFSEGGREMGWGHRAESTRRPCPQQGREGSRDRSATSVSPVICAIER